MYLRDDMGVLFDLLLIPILEKGSALNQKNGKQHHQHHTDCIDLHTLNCKYTIKRSADAISEYVLQAIITIQQLLVGNDSIMSVYYNFDTHADRWPLFQRYLPSNLLIRSTFSPFQQS